MHQTIEIKKSFYLILSRNVQSYTAHVFRQIKTSDVWKHIINKILIFVNTVWKVKKTAVSLHMYGFNIVHSLLLKKHYIPN